MEVAEWAAKPNQAAPAEEEDPVEVDSMEDREVSGQADCSNRKLINVHYNVINS